MTLYRDDVSVKHIDFMDHELISPLILKHTQTDESNQWLCKCCGSRNIPTQM